MGKYSVAFVTGSRAEYGIVRRYLKKLQDDEEVDLTILVTGALLSNKYAHQVDLIYADGLNVGAEIDIEPDASSNVTISHSMAIGMEEFGKYFGEHSFDLLIVLGDRFEMLPVAIAAAMARIPILHIHGGEATYANYDEFIRHSITKMSTYHFASTEDYRRRIIQLGENPENVYNLGSLGAENCLSIDEGAVSAEIKALTDQKYFVVIFNPETLEDADGVRVQIDELLAALSERGDYKFVILGNNADTYADIIRERIFGFVNSHENARFFENLTTNDYHYLLKHSCGLIGNSSSGLIEAPSLGVCTVNIGNRQAGRIRGNSVFDVDCKKADILNAMDSIIGIKDSISIENPYYKENALMDYYLTTKKILEHQKQNGIEFKKFYDLPR